jgi:hypothetical protein
MKLTRRALPLTLTGLGAWAQEPVRPRPGEDPRATETLPDGRLKSETVLKADHESNLKDLDEIDRLVALVREDLKKNEQHVLSMTNLKSLEEIEKTAKRVHSRMRRM